MHIQQGSNLASFSGKVLLVSKERGYFSHVFKTTPEVVFKTNHTNHGKAIFLSQKSKTKKIDVPLLIW